MGKLTDLVNLTQILKGAKPVDPKTIKKFREEMEQNMRDMQKPKPTPKCHWCGSEDVKPLHGNGIIGPGYAVSDWVCKACGRVL